MCVYVSVCVFKRESVYEREREREDRAGGDSHEPDGVPEVERV